MVADDRDGATERYGEGQGTSVEDMRQELEASRRRMSQDLEVIERRLRRVAEDLRGRMDVLQPARSRIRQDVWGSLAVAFGAGLVFAVMTAKRGDGRRGFAGEVLRSTASAMPGAVASGVRAGIGDALRRAWRNRPEPREKRARSAA